MAYSHCTGPGQGPGNDRFLYCAMYCTYYTGTGTGTGNHYFLLCPFRSLSRAVCMSHKEFSMEGPLQSIIHRTWVLWVGGGGEHWYPVLDFWEHLAWVSNPARIPLICVLCHLHDINSSDSHLVRHLLVGGHRVFFQWWMRWFQKVLIWLWTCILFKKFLLVLQSHNLM